MPHDAACIGLRARIGCGDRSVEDTVFDENSAFGIILNAHDAADVGIVAAGVSGYVTGGCHVGHGAVVTVVYVAHNQGP